MEKRTTPTDQTHKTPTTLLEAVRYFADENVAHSYAAKLRWPDGPTCPRCECREYSYLTTRKLWKCKNRECRYQYSLKVNTIFEDSPLGFEKWLPAIWLLTNAKNGISSHELGRALGVHQETAWHMLGRIRHAMDTGTFEKLSGEVEADESFVGGLSRNMHAHIRREKKVGRGRTPGNKTAVFGAIQRDGEVRAEVIPNVHKQTVQQQIHRMVEPGSTLYTDKFPSYTGLDEDYDHQTIDHAIAYVEGGSVRTSWRTSGRS